MRTGFGCIYTYVYPYVHMCMQEFQEFLVFEDYIYFASSINSQNDLKLLQVWIRFPIHLPVVYLVPGSDIY